MYIISGIFKCIIRNIFYRHSANRTRNNNIHGCSNICCDRSALFIKFKIVFRQRFIRHLHQHGFLTNSAYSVIPRIIQCCTPFSHLFIRRICTEPDITQFNPFKSLSIDWYICRYHKLTQRSSGKSS